MGYSLLNASFKTHVAAHTAANSGDGPHEVRTGYGTGAGIASGWSDTERQRLLAKENIATIETSALSLV